MAGKSTAASAAVPEAVTLNSDAHHRDEPGTGPSHVEV